MKIKDYDRMKFPQAEEEVVIEVIREALNVDEETSRILWQHSGSVEGAFSNLDMDSFCIRRYLGENFYQLDMITEEEGDLLSQLCQKGWVKGKVLTETLKNAGVIKIDKKMYWMDENSRINYSLQAGKVCQPREATKQQLKTAFNMDDKDESDGGEEKEKKKKKVKEKKQK